MILPSKCEFLKTEAADDTCLRRVVVVAPSFFQRRRINFMMDVI